MNIDEMKRYFGKGDKIVYEDVAEVPAWVFCDEIWCDNCGEDFKDHDQVVAASDTMDCFHRYCTKCWEEYKKQEDNKSIVEKKEAIQS